MTWRLVIASSFAEIDSTLYLPSKTHLQCPLNRSSYRRSRSLPPLQFPLVRSHSPSPARRFEIPQQIVEKQTDPKTRRTI
ncbi:hypothetical protein L1049_019333 [Liquidambar formosana]|uniref:Uncharacterized protein n=1 Tax=Liquidambar formosana TaxID=63359 RepID=A0AAP0S6B5_LIQFO